MQLNAMMFQTLKIPALHTDGRFAVGTAAGFWIILSSSFKVRFGFGLLLVCLFVSLSFIWLVFVFGFWIF